MPAKTFLSLLLAIATASLGLLALAGYVPNIWFCDLCSQFRLVYATFFLVCFVLFACFKNKLWIVISALLMISNDIPIASMIFPRSCEVADGGVLTILNFNTEFQHNDHYGLFRKLILEKNPDLIVLVEVNRKWIDQIEAATQSYPYKKIELTGAGMAIFSKYPLEQIEVRKFGISHHPRIFTDVRVQRRILHLLLVHPTTPQSEYGFKERNGEFSLIRTEFDTISGAKILLGDFNCGPWSPAFANLLSPGVQDSEQGYGPQPSWPARTGRVLENIPICPLIPIDHLLVSSEICVRERVVGPPMESDHLPVFAKLSFRRTGL